MGKLRFAIILVLTLFFFSALYRSFYQPSGGHVWRQTDTMGMAYVFAAAWKSGPQEIFDDLIRPRVLQAGTGSGINATEFPILNFLVSPFWFLSPRWAAALSVLLLFVFNVWVASRFFNYLLNRLNSDSLGSFESVAIYFSVDLVSERAITFMPEGFGFPLSIVSLAFLVKFLETPKNVYLLIGGVASAFAILVKPIFVVLIPLYFCCLYLMKKISFDRRVVFVLFCFALSILPGFYWYTFHAEYLDSISKTEQYFRRAEFSPLRHLMEFDFISAGKFLFHEVAYSHFPFFFGLVLLGVALFRKPAIAAVYLVSFAALCVLGGRHVVVHQYYLLPCGLFSLILISLMWNDRSAYIKGISRAAVLVGLLWSIRCNLFAVAKADMSVWEEGQRISQFIRPDAHVITDDQTYPRKLLAVKRSGAMKGERALETCLKGESNKAFDIIMNKERFENAPIYVRASFKLAETPSTLWVLLRCI